MIINIKVITKAKENKIRETAGGLRVYLTAVPEKGKANKAIVKLLAERYNKSKNQIEIISGEKSKNKKVEIID
jgi:uncharacterized protein